MVEKVRAAVSLVEAVLLSVGRDPRQQQKEKAALGLKYVRSVKMLVELVLLWEIAASLYHPLKECQAINCALAQTDASRSIMETIHACTKWRYWKTLG